MKLKRGVTLLDNSDGDGPVIRRQHYYRVAMRLTLNKGDVIQSPNQCLSHSVDKHATVHADGFFEHRVRIDREHLIPGIFYAVQGMKVGGYRKVVISPHLGYGVNGLPGIVPANAKLVVEIKVLEEA